LAVVAMTASAWASDEVGVRVGDWVEMKRTTTIAPDEMDSPVIMTILMRVKAIEDSTVILDFRNTTRIPGKGQPDVTSNELKIPLVYLNSTDSKRHLDAEMDGIMKVEVLEEGERTVEVNGATFEGVFYQKVKITLAANEHRPGAESVTELWDDGKTPFSVVGMGVGALKTVTTTMTTTPQGPVAVVNTVERVAYGRAGDPIPEDK